MPTPEGKEAVVKPETLLLLHETTVNFDDRVRKAKLSKSQLYDLKECLQNMANHHLSELLEAGATHLLELHTQHTDPRVFVNTHLDPEKEMKGAAAVREATGIDFPRLKEQGFRVLPAKYYGGFGGAFEIPGLWTLSAPGIKGIKFGAPLLDRGNFLARGVAEAAKKSRSELGIEFSSPASEIQKLDGLVEKYGRFLSARSVYHEGVLQGLQGDLELIDEEFGDSKRSETKQSIEIQKKFISELSSFIASVKKPSEQLQLSRALGVQTQLILLGLNADYPDAPPKLFKNLKKAAGTGLASLQPQETIDVSVSPAALKNKGFMLALAEAKLKAVI